MRPDEYETLPERDSQRGGRFELFYFEQVGSGTYLRFTRLMVFLIVGLTVLSILLLFALILSNKRGRPEDVDINILAPTGTPQDYNKSALQPVAPGSTPPKVIKQHRASVPPSPTLTPSPTPARTPP